MKTFYKFMVEGALINADDYLFSLQAIKEDLPVGPAPYKKETGW
jgi:hypothetical protein